MVNQAFLARQPVLVGGVLVSWMAWLVIATAVGVDVRNIVIYTWADVWVGALLGAIGCANAFAALCCLGVFSTDAGMHARMLSVCDSLLRWISVMWMLALGVMVLRVV